MKQHRNPFLRIFTNRFLALTAAATLLWTLPLHAWVKVGEPAPSFTLKDMKGKSHSLAGRQITVLYFFDADSQSSREGISNLVQLAGRHKSAVRILAISGSSPEKLSGFAKETGARFPILYDEGKVRVLYNAKMILPVVCAVGSDRKVLDYHQGGGKSLQNMLGRLSDRIKAGVKPEPAQATGKTTITRPAARPTAAAEPSAVREREMPKVRPSQELVQPTPVKIVTSKRVYVNGDLLSMKITTSHDNFLSLFHVASDDTVTMLIPNQLQHYYFLRSGEPLDFPYEGIELRASSTPGKKKETETLLALSTLEPVDFEKEIPADRPFHRADLMKIIAGIPAHTRALAETSYDILEK